VVHGLAVHRRVYRRNERGRRDCLVDNLAQGRRGARYEAGVAVVGDGDRVGGDRKVRGAEAGAAARERALTGPCFRASRPGDSAHVEGKRPSTPGSSSRS
jgi:hypothetical protein